ncbi:MAG: hypothetical protein IT186_22055 [Acidobacteria bacterium]|nr:hypothetical protein [Acidobacteriota bacterium]
MTPTHAPVVVSQQSVGRGAVWASTIAGNAASARIHRAACPEALLALEFLARPGRVE